VLKVVILPPEAAGDSSVVGYPRPLRSQPLLP